MVDRLIATLRWSLVMAIVIVSGILMLNAAISDSAIVDEVAHISAGYSYLKFFDYRLNPEHPPLVKVLAALPLIFQNPSWPSEASAKDEWTIGNDFLYHSGNNADSILLYSRLAPILLTLLLILIIYIWAKEIIGRWWALLPTFLFAFSPLILSHGHYVTTDIGATLGVVGAMAMFLRFLFHPSKVRAVLAGLILGLALLMKFSTLILVPYFMLLTIIYAVVEAIGRSSTTGEAWRGDWSRYFKFLLLIFFITFVVVYGTYYIFTFNSPSDNTLLRPLESYVTGLKMTWERTLGGNTLYFLGETATSAYWYYFPVVFTLKEPLASLILIIFAGIASLFSSIKSAFRPGTGLGAKIKEYLTTHFTEFAMISFIILYWAFSMAGNLNIGLRHVLPTIPFIYILTAGVIKRWFSSENMARGSNLVLKIIIVSKELFSLSLKTTLLVILLVWFSLSVVLATPQYLSYFNFLGGGLTNGYKYVADSNYDWGQDLRRLKTYIDQVNSDEDPENNIERIAVDYFGGGDVKYYLGDTAEPWWSARGNPKAQGINWLAISANTLQVAKGKLTEGSERKPEDEYRWLVNPEPFARAGTSIFIYKF